MWTFQEPDVQEWGQFTFSSRSTVTGDCIRDKLSYYLFLYSVIIHSYICVPPVSYYVLYKDLSKGLLCKDPPDWPTNSCWLYLCLSLSSTLENIIVSSAPGASESLCQYHWVSEPVHGPTQVFAELALQSAGCRILIEPEQNWHSVLVETDRTSFHGYQKQSTTLTPFTTTFTRYTNTFTPPGLWRVG